MTSPDLPPFDADAFQQDVAGLVERINDALTRLLPPAGPQAARLHDACAYSLTAGGKRLRPMLVLMACEAAGGEPDAALPAACAWEYVHTYSLVHDDLPAMDNDTLRRGQPTTWKQFGEAHAILAGDALMTEAFGLIARHAPSAEIAQQLVLELADASGIGGMVGGQVADIEAEGQPPDEDRLRFIHRHKTGALLRPAVRAGGRLAAAGGPVFAALDAYGESLGLAFQVVDDVLDVTQSAEHLGKSAGKDVDQGKLTYPAVYGVERSRGMARDLITRALDAVAPLGPPAARLVAMAQFVLHRTN